MYEKILLAYDGTREARTVLKEGAELAQRCGAEVQLMAVVSPSAGITFAEAAEPTGLADEEEKHVEEVLAEGLEKLKARGLKAETILCKGDPAVEILAQARNSKADLIVLGHRHRTAFSRWWRSSVAEEILAGAPCSLLVAVAETTE